MERKERFWIAFFMIVILAVCLFWRESGDEREAKEVPYVAIRTEYYTGQGAVYDRDESGSYLVTAGHVLSGLEKGDVCTVIFSGGKESSAEVYYLSDTADVAFLRVKEDAVPDMAIPVKTDRKYFDALQEGDGLYAVALSGRQERTAEGVLVSSWIYLDDFSLNMMLLKMDVTGGMSGSAVLEENGYFVGIVCGVSEEKEAAVLPFSIIESEWMLAKMQ